MSTGQHSSHRAPCCANKKTAKQPFCCPLGPRQTTAGDKGGEIAARRHKTTQMSRDETLRCHHLTVVRWCLHPQRHTASPSPAAAGKREMSPKHEFHRDTFCSKRRTGDSRSRDTGWGLRLDGLSRGGHTEQPKSRRCGTASRCGTAARSLARGHGHLPGHTAGRDGAWEAGRGFGHQHRHPCRALRCGTCPSSPQACQPPAGLPAAAARRFVLHHSPPPHHHHPALCPSRSPSLRGPRCAWGWPCPRLGRGCPEQGQGQKQGQGQGMSLSRPGSAPGTAGAAPAPPRPGSGTAGEMTEIGGLMSTALRLPSQTALGESGNRAALSPAVNTLPGSLFPSPCPATRARRPVPFKSISNSSGAAFISH